MDVVYRVRPGSYNEELRHSLRSLANLPHDRVWMFGAQPRWVTGVEHVPVAQGQGKHDNTWAIWRAMAACADLPDTFIAFDDDFFVMRPVADVPTLHRGPLDDWIRARGGSTVRRMLDTRDALLAAGRRDLYAYELHVPMVIDRRWLAEVMAYAEHYRRRTGAGPLCKRSLYGNYVGLGGQQADDVKLRAREEVPDPSWSFVSTSDATFGYGRAGRILRAAFPAPSAYENDQPRAMYLPRAVARQG